MIVCVPPTGCSLPAFCHHSLKICVTENNHALALSHDKQKKREKKKKKERKAKEKKKKRKGKIRLMRSKRSFSEKRIIGSRKTLGL